MAYAPPGYGLQRVARRPQLGQTPLTAVVSGASLVESVLGIGGATQQQKDAARVKRANELLQCALGGDIQAAQRLLYGAGLFGAPGSSSGPGKSQYAANVMTLQAKAPQTYNAAVQQGPQPDTGSGTGCPSIGVSSTTGAPAVVAGTGATPAASVMGLSSNTLLLVGGVGLAFLLASRKR